MPKNNIYIILGGGVNKNGNLPNHVLNRVDLVSNIATKEDLIIASSSFSLNIPPKLDKNNYVIFESTQIAREMKKRGFKNIITENWSHDTIGSAIFCRMLICSIDVNFQKIIVVTSDFHFDRASNIFKWAFNSLKPVLKKIEVLSVESYEDNSEDLIKRNHKEKQSNISFERNFKNILDFDDALLSLLLNHDNYNLNLFSKHKNKYEISMY